MTLRRSSPPPPGSVRCSVCVNFAWHDVGQHAVKSGGAWHHPSCPQLGQPKPRFFKRPPAIKTVSPIQRLLIVFRDHVSVSGVAFYTLGLTLVAVIVPVFFAACMSGCAELARDSYEHDLRQCAIDNKGKSDAEYAACKRDVKSEWHVEAGVSNGSE